ncbi:MAG: molybdopterin molybdotransferase MoeA [Planctomycetaceae bacterium]|nr:molybdopterin molybdotransferase MoeA [Planctomycetaceae bacterium]
MLSVHEALQVIRDTVTPSPPRTLSLTDAWGTVLAQDIVSREDSPPFDKSMMDGYAVRKEDISAEETTLEVVDEVTAGNVSQTRLTAGQAIRIMTGAPIPAGADAVVPIEWTESTNSASVLIRPQRSVHSGLNIIPRGQAMKQGETVLGAGRTIRAQELALLSELGCAEIDVRPRPVIAVLATGDELVPVDQTPGPGQIRNSNGLMLSAQVEQAGGIPKFLGIARDERSDLRQKIESGLEADFLCLSGGVSAGKLDLVPSELAAAGVRQVFHKIQMKPGKPIWFGILERSSLSPCYVFGLPGNPVSSMVCFELFVRDALRRWQGMDSKSLLPMRAVLRSEFRYASDRPVYWPAHLAELNGQLVVHPVNWKGSSDLRSVADANCSVVLPPAEATLPAGSLLEILPWGLTMGTMDQFTPHFG